MSATEALPLADLTVLEFSHAVMGSCAGMILANLDAASIMPHRRNAMTFETGSPR